MLKKLFVPEIPVKRSIIILAISIITLFISIICFFKIDGSSFYILKFFSSSIAVISFTLFTSIFTKTVKFSLRILSIFVLILLSCFSSKILDFFLTNAFFISVISIVSLFKNAFTILAVFEFIILIVVIIFLLIIQINCIKNFIFPQYEVLCCFFIFLLSNLIFLIFGRSLCNYFYSFCLHTDKRLSSNCCDKLTTEKEHSRYERNIIFQYVQIYYIVFTIGTLVYGNQIINIIKNTTDLYTTSFVILISLYQIDWEIILNDFKNEYLEYIKFLRKEI